MKANAKYDDEELEILQAWEAGLSNICRQFAA